MKLPTLPLTRLFCTVLVLLLVVLWLNWRWGSRGSVEVQELPALRIVCEGSDKVVRCPSDCTVDDDGEAQCRCQDFYYQRGGEPLRFSHSLCR